MSQSSTVGSRWNDYVARGYITEEDLEIFDSYTYHVIVTYQEYMYILAGDSASFSGQYSGNCSVGNSTTGSFYIYARNDTTYLYDKVISETSGTGAYYNGIWWSDFDCVYNGQVIHASDVIIGEESGIHITRNGINFIVHKSNNGPYTKLLDTSDANANAGDILFGKTAYKNNTKITGTMNNLGDLSIIPNITGGTINSGFVNSINVSAVNASIDPNITASNIANGVNILGVIGNYEGSSGGGINVPNWDINAMLDTDITGVQSVNINNISDFYMLQSNNTSIIVNGFRFTNGYRLYLNNIKYINIDNFDIINNRSTYLDISKSNYLTDLYVNNMLRGTINASSYSAYQSNSILKNCYIGNISNAYLYLNNCVNLTNFNINLISNNALINISSTKLNGNLLLNIDGQIKFYAQNCSQINKVFINAINTNNRFNLYFSWCQNLETIDFNCNEIYLSGDIFSNSNIFSGCSNLININTNFINFIHEGTGSINFVDQYNAACTNGMFYSCTALSDIPQFNLGNYMYTGSATDWGMGLEIGAYPGCGDMFNYCNNLSNNALNNIAISLNKTITGPICYEENCEPALSYNFSIGSVSLYIMNMDTMEDEFKCRYGLGLSNDQVNYISNLPIWSDLTSKGWSNRVTDIHL